MLSTFAVALQGATPTAEGESNVAAATLAQGVPKAPAVKAASSATGKVKCEPAFEEYKTYVETGGKVKIECTVEGGYTGVRCPGSGAGCSNIKDPDSVLKLPVYTTGCKIEKNYKAAGYTSSAQCESEMKSLCKDIRPKEVFCPGPESKGGKLVIRNNKTKVDNSLSCVSKDGKNMSISCNPEKSDPVGKGSAGEFSEQNKNLLADNKDADTEGRRKLGDLGKGLQQTGGDTQGLLDRFKDDALTPAQEAAEQAAKDAKAASDEALRLKSLETAACAGAKAASADCTNAKAATKTASDALKDAQNEKSLKDKELSQLKQLASAMQPTQGSPTYNPTTGQCEKFCGDGKGPNGGPSGGQGPYNPGPGTPYPSQKDNTFGGGSKSLSDLGKMLSSMAQQPQQRPAPGSGSGAAGQPPQCTQTYSTSYDYYGSSQPSSTNCQCQSGLTLQNGYCQGGNQCPQGYVNSGGTCQPASATSPVATITSCEPRIQDVGQSVTITYSCQNAVAAEGVGFTTNGVSGTGTALIEKQGAGVSKVSYGLICTGQNGQKAQARQCDVAVYNPTIVMVSNPTRIENDKDTTIGWVTKGMKSCTVGSEDPDLVEWDEDQEGNTNVSGSVKTPSLDEDTEFILTCTTQGGNSKDSKITVDVI